MDSVISLVVIALFIIILYGWSKHKYNKKLYMLYKTYNGAPRIDDDDDKWQVIKSNTYETVIDLIRQMVKDIPTDARYLFIIDSMDALVPRGDLEKSSDEALSDYPDFSWTWSATATTCTPIGEFLFQQKPEMDQNGHNLLEVLHLYQGKVINSSLIMYALYIK